MRTSLLVILTFLAACQQDDVTQVATASPSTVLATQAIPPVSGHGHGAGSTATVTPDGAVHWSGGQWILPIPVPAGATLTDCGLSLIDNGESIGVFVMVTNQNGVQSLIGSAMTTGSGDTEVVHVALHYTSATGDQIVAISQPTNTSVPSVLTGADASSLRVLVTNSIVIPAAAAAIPVNSGATFNPGGQLWVASRFDDRVMFPVTVSAGSVITRIDVFVAHRSLQPARITLHGSDLATGVLTTIATAQVIGTGISDTTLLPDLTIDRLTEYTVEFAAGGEQDDVRGVVIGLN